MSYLEPRRGVQGSIKAPIFGATEIAFGAQLAVGLGHSVDCTTAIDFTEIFLAGKEQFRNLIYLPTLAKGYKMDLMTQEAKNLHYLNKCIARIGEDIEGLTELLDGLARVPTEKQKLLMQVDDDFEEEGGTNPLFG